MGPSEKPTTRKEREEFTKWCDAVLNGELVSFHNGKALAADISRLIRDVERRDEALEAIEERAQDADFGEDVERLATIAEMARAILEERDDRPS